MNAHVIQMPALDGSNPLAFLAALGVLRALSVVPTFGEAQLSWTASLNPRIHTAAPAEPDDLVAALLAALQRLITDGVASMGDIIGVQAGDYDAFVRNAVARLPEDAARRQLLFAAAFGNSAVVDAKKGTIVPNALSFSNGQGGKLLLKDFRTLVGALTKDHLHQALFEPWRYEDKDVPTFRWDPQDMRTGAHMATDPGSTPTRSVMGANALAFVGLSFLVATPTARGLETTAVRRTTGETAFCWPLWSSPLGADVVASLLQQGRWDARQGIVAAFAAPRINFKKNLYLGNSVALVSTATEE